MDREASGIRQRLVSQWSEVVAALDRMSPGASVSPNDGWAVIRPVESSGPEFSKFQIAPTVFNVPERANHSAAMLYVATEGWIELRREDFRLHDALVTHAFATHVAYFRRSAEFLEHVYGAHYDAAIDELGHPTFHAQMRSYANLGTEVLKQFHLDLQVRDHVRDVLRTVRVPTAQMDAFSLVLQIFADHMLNQQSGPEERATFNALLQKSLFLKGAAARAPRLITEVARSCYRSLHWYPMVN